MEVILNARFFSVIYRKLFRLTHHNLSFDPPPHTHTHTKNAIFFFFFFFFFHVLFISFIFSKCSDSLIVGFCGHSKRDTLGLSFGLEAFLTSIIMDKGRRSCRVRTKELGKELYLILLVRLFSRRIQYARLTTKPAILTTMFSIATGQWYKWYDVHISWMISTVNSSKYLN